MSNPTADVIAYNGKIATQNEQRSMVEAVAIRDGKFLAVGTDREMMAWRGVQTQLINLNERTAIPSLNDSHTHLIRGGLNYNLELRWDGVPSLADGLRMLREQARRTPSGQWVRVVGGWSEFQFAERRMPTLDELNKAAPDTPVFVLHLYDRALLNRAALRAVGYTRENFLKNLSMMGGLLFVASTRTQYALIRSIYVTKAAGSLDEIASHSESRV
jgi:predicted amidohydrolase YtcJ